MPNSSDFNRFEVNPVSLDMNRSLFNMNHSVKWSANVGECIPFEVTEILPGDTVTVDTSKVVRLQPLVAPIMDEVILDTYYFFVPNRLVWSHWKEFMGENNQSAWAPEVSYSIPRITPPIGGFDVGTIADYMGVPVKYQGESISALPFRAYALICDQWFRSESVMNPVHVHVDDTNRVGVNTGDQSADIELGGKPFIACKYFDYFTGCLPAPQRGEASMISVVNTDYTDPRDSKDFAMLPVSSFSSSKHGLHKPFGRLGESSYYDGEYGDGISFTVNSGDSYTRQTQKHIVHTNTDGFAYNDSPTDSTTLGFKLHPDNLYAMLYSDQLGKIAINDLRTAFAIQKYLEKQARFGGRYIEFIRGFFGVDSPDARLQRTEYLGGSRLSLNINQVEQTSATQTGSTPLGNVAGMSVTGDTNSDFTKSFTEHGYLIGIAVLRYHHSYQQGLDRMWSRKTSYDFYNPVFANLGEQAVNLREIYYDTNTSNTTIFGYQERWAEYRYKPNRIAGELRSKATNTLDMWHLGDYYTSRPFLNSAWLREDKSMLDRALAVTSDVSNQCICDFYIKMEMSRIMPLYSIPGLIDHH